MCGDAIYHIIEREIIMARDRESFRLDDEARARIDMEYSEVSSDFETELSRAADDSRSNEDDAQRRSSQRERNRAPQLPRRPRPVRRRPLPEEVTPRHEERRRRRPPRRTRDDRRREVYPSEREGAFGDESENPDEEFVPVRRKKHRLIKFAVRVMIFCGILLLFNIGLLIFSGQLWFNEPKKRDYPVRGPVITEKLGAVEWEKFAKQNIQMAYIRATKSTVYEDARCKKNMNGSAKTDLPTGMLHIFDPLMDGSDQADHFIEVCGDMEGRLRPAVEIQVGMFRRLTSPDMGKTAERLREYCDRIEEEYGCTPVIKCDKAAYENIVKDERFEDCPIWYECEYNKPEDDVRWDYWGYSSRVKFNFYENRKFLEMAVLKGDKDRLDELTVGYYE